jgi:hypothetical protein
MEDKYRMVLLCATRKTNRDLPNGTFGGKCSVMPLYEETLKTLETAIRDQYGTMAGLADAMGIPPNRLTRWFSGERGPRFKELAEVIDFLSARAHFPAPMAPTSSAPFFSEPPALYAGEPVECVPASHYVFIEKALARPAAGGGSLETSGETEGGLMFRLEWISNKTTSSPKRLRIMEVGGVSMSPTIEHGDVVLVDEGNTTLVADRVYVVRKGEGIHVKRFREIPGGGMLFMGDNRARDFEDVRVEPGDGDDFAVIGRVLWAGKEL